jgi:hypothetical protein
MTGSNTQHVGPDAHTDPRVQRLVGDPDLTDPQTVPTTHINDTIAAFGRPDLRVNPRDCSLRLPKDDLVTRVPADTKDALLQPD